MQYIIADDAAFAIILTKGGASVAILPTNGAQVRAQAAAMLGMHSRGLGARHMLRRICWACQEPL